MKILSYKVLFSVFVFLTYHLTFAQVGPVGYYIDNSLKEINGYVDKDYIPTKPYLFLESIYNFQAGGYVDLKGEFHKGKIEIISRTKTIWFSEDKEDAKPIMLGPDDVQSYVVAKDSFLTVHNFKTEYSTYKHRFMLKLLTVNGVQYYRHYPVNSALNFFFVKEGQFVRIDNDRSGFISTMEGIAGEYDTLYNDIKNEKLKHEDTPLILSTLKVHFDFVNQTAQYYDKNWIEVNSRNEALFYSKVTKLENYSADIAYYDLHDNKILEIQGWQVNKTKKNGMFIWYYPEGSIRKKANFDDDKEVDKSEEYFRNGIVHYQYSVNQQNEREYYVVNDSLGNNILDRSGVEKIIDSVNRREITRRYQSGALVESYFTDSLERTVYLLTKKNVSPKDGLLRIPYKISYPKYARDSVLEGMVLLSVLVNPKGVVESVKIVNGISDSVDEEIRESFLDAFLTVAKPFRPASNGKDKVFQELVFPLIFSFTSENLNNYIYDPFFINYQLFEMNHIIDQQMIENAKPIVPPYIMK